MSDASTATLAIFTTNGTTTITTTTSTSVSTTAATNTTSTCSTTTTTANLYYYFYHISLHTQYKPLRCRPLPLLALAFFRLALLRLHPRQSLFCLSPGLRHIQPADRVAALCLADVGVLLAVVAEPEDT